MSLLPNREDELLKRIVRRLGTQGGCGVLVPVTTAATSKTVTLARSESDTKYGVVVTPSWLTTVAVISRTTAGFVVSFGTAAPAGGTVDWCLFRSED